MPSRSNLPIHPIQAAVLRPGGLPLQIESLELEGPRDDEVLVRVVASGICHTDIGFCDDWDGPPVVLGHEGAGVAVQAGRRVTVATPGDHVVLSYMSCGECRECQDGHPAGCENLYEANFGFARLDGSNAYRGRVRGHFFGQSSFATHALATAHNLVKVPKDLPLELLAPLGCGFQTGAGTVINSLAVPEGASLAVFGTGAVGLAAVMAARLAGARPIVGVDIHPQRLKLALELGATHAIDSRIEDVVSRLAAITAGGVDYVIDTTGAATLYQAARKVVKPGGAVALIANPGGGGILPGGGRILGIIQGDSVPQDFIPKMIAWHRAGQFPFDRLVKFYDFGEINQAMDDSRRGDTIKPVLRISQA